MVTGQPDSEKSWLPYGGVPQIQTFSSGPSFPTRPQPVSAPRPFPSQFRRHTTSTATPSHANCRRREAQRSRLLVQQSAPPQRREALRSRLPVQRRAPLPPPSSQARGQRQKRRVAESQSTGLKRRAPPLPRPSPRRAARGVEKQTPHPAARPFAIWASPQVRGESLKAQRN